MESLLISDAQPEVVHGKGPVKDKSGRYKCNDVTCTETFKRRCEWK
jgi:hypothetical protein